MSGSQSGRTGTEAADPRYADLDTWPIEAVLDALGEAQMTAAAIARHAAPQIAHATRAAAPRIARGGRLFYVGAGTSGRVGVQDGVELTPTFGFPPERLVLLMAGGPHAATIAVEGAEDDEAAACADLLAHDPGPDDVVIGIAASGATPYTAAAIACARKRGCLTIAFSGSAEGRLAREAEVSVALATGPEVVAGSTRLKAGTAQKAALNMFSTALMIELGHVHGNRMVDMKVTNAKLARRAEGMVAAIVGGTEEQIGTALRQADGNVKRAALIRAGCAPGSVEALLERHAGRLRGALAELAAR